MAYKFNITRGSAILNFSEEFCQSRCQLIESESFAKVIEKYIKDIRRRDTTIYNYLHKVQNDDVDLLSDLRSIFKLLLVMSVKELCLIRKEMKPYFEDKDMFIELVEDIYLFWRRLQRYAVVFNETTRGAGYQNVQFADAQNEFEELVLEVYRSIQSALGKKDKVLRQITAGVNAGLTVTHMRPFLPYEYRNLDEIPFIESVVIHPPFIAYSKRNKRDGVFPEVKNKSYRG